MRIKLLVILAALLLVSSICFAQTVREPAYNYEGKTNYIDLSVGGFNTDGNPGYIEFVAMSAAGETIYYYLWVEADTDGTGNLMLASGVIMRAFTTSFPTLDWRDCNAGVDTVGP